MGSGDADAMLFCSSGMKGCPPQVLRGSLCRTFLSDTATVQHELIYLTKAKNNSLDLVLTYMDNSSKYKIANNTKRIYRYYILAILCSHVLSF